MVDMVNAITDLTCPVRAQLVHPANDGSGTVSWDLQDNLSAVTSGGVDDSVNDGSGLVSGTDLPDGLAAVTSGGTATEAATTGIFEVPGENNNFEIYSVSTGTTENGYGVVFIHEPGLLGRVSASWDYDSGENGVLFVTFDPDTATADDLRKEVNALGAPVLARLVFDNDGADTLPGTGDLADSFYRRTAGGSGTDVATIGTIFLPGSNDDFEIVATTPGNAGNDINVLFVHDAAGGASAQWFADAGPNGTLVASFRPGSTRAVDLVDAINGVAGALVTARLVDDPVNDGSGFANFDSVTRTTSTAAPGDYAVDLDGPIRPAGDYNDFEIVASVAGGAGSNVQIAFVHGTGSALTTSWERYGGLGNGLLTVTYDRDVTKASELVGAINGVAAAPLEARLIVEVANDGSDVIQGGDLPSATPSRLTTGGGAAATASTGTYNITGSGTDDAFEIFWDTEGTAGNDHEVLFVHNDTGTVSVDWDSALGDDGVLLISFEPGVTTAAELVAAVNGSGTQFTAQLVLDADASANDGLGTLPGTTPLADGLAGKTSGGTSSGDVASTGVFQLNGLNNDFEIHSTTSGTAGNDIGIVFIHNTTPPAAPTASWDANAGTAGVLTVYYVPDTTTAQDIITAINNSTAPLQADSVTPEIGAPPGAIATTGVFNVPGLNNNFEIHATSNGASDNGYGVVFIQEAGTGSVSAAWNSGAGEKGVLFITFDPGTATANQLVAAVNASGVPLVAELVNEGGSNNGSGTLAAGAPLTDSLAARTSGATGPGTVATTGAFTLTGVNNDFEIRSSLEGTGGDGNGVGVVFVQTSSGSGASADWTAAAGSDGVVTVTYRPNVTTAQQIINAINSSGAPLNAQTITPEPGAPQNSGTGAIAINASWHLLSTNNSEHSSLTDLDELPRFLSTSSDASPPPSACPGALR